MIGHPGARGAVGAPVGEGRAPAGAPSAPPALAPPPPEPLPGSGGAHRPRRRSGVRDPVTSSVRGGPGGKLVGLRTLSGRSGRSRRSAPPQARVDPGVTRRGLPRPAPIRLAATEPKYGSLAPQPTLRPPRPAHSSTARGEAGEARQDLPGRGRDANDSRDSRPPLPWSSSGPDGSARLQQVQEDPGGASRTRPRHHRRERGRRPLPASQPWLWPLRAARFSAGSRRPRAEAMRSKTTVPSGGMLAARPKRPVHSPQRRRYQAAAATTT